MDTVHYPGGRSWISERIKLKSYFDSFKEKLAANQTPAINTKTLVQDRRQLTDIRVRKMMETQVKTTQGNKATTTAGLPTNHGAAAMTDNLFEEIIAECSIDKLR